MRAGVSSDKIEHDDAHWHREAVKMNVRLQQTGHTSQQINAWWNTTPHPLLGNRTPMQAWATGREQVLAIDP
jgi:hypothetical protein